MYNSHLLLEGEINIQASGFYVSGVHAFLDAQIDFKSGSVVNINASQPPGLSSNSGGYGIYTWSNATTNIEEGAVVNIKTLNRGGVGNLDRSTFNLYGQLNIDVSNTGSGTTLDYYAIANWSTIYGGNQFTAYSGAELNIKSTQRQIFLNGAKDLLEANRFTWEAGSKLSVSTPQGAQAFPVSYTHLTLPTKLEV